MIEFITIVKALELLIELNIIRGTLFKLSHKQKKDIESFLDKVPIPNEEIFRKYIKDRKISYREALKLIRTFSLREIKEVFKI